MKKVFFLICAVIACRGVGEAQIFGGGCFVSFDDPTYCFYSDVIKISNCRHYNVKSNSGRDSLIDVFGTAVANLCREALDNVDDFNTLVDDYNANVNDYNNLNAQLSALRASSAPLAASVNSLGVTNRKQAARIKKLLKACGKKCRGIK